MWLLVGGVVEGGGTNRTRRRARGAREARREWTIVVGTS